MHELEPGPRRLDGDVNPYTGEPIAKLNSDNWADASPVDLYKQLGILENRMLIAHTLGKVEIIQQLQSAIQRCKAAISEAIVRDSKRPIRKRPNTPEQRRTGQLHTGFE